MPVEAVVWADVRNFYTERAGAPAWVEHRKLSKRAAEALQILRTAREHGFAPEDYGESQIVHVHDVLKQSDKDSPGRPQQLAEFDVRVTTALLAFGRDVALGRARPEAIDRRWKARREAPDLASALKQAFDGDLSTWIDAVRPPHPEYVALQKALADLRGQVDKGGWPNAPAGTFTLGTSHPSVIALRQRLAAGGQVKGAAATNMSPVYDTDIANAVRAVQDLHGLKATGIADPATLAAMNVPIEDRITQVTVNLERWRWMPNDFGSRHLLVNIPFYHLIARENGNPVRDIRVVVGKVGNETPIFSDEMESVVFSPYWNIPDTIVANETAPAVARDPAYLGRNHIEILRVSGSDVATLDPSDVDWDDPGTLRGLAFRQRPGSTNALGHVKFLFPNGFDVYLHDTPADNLFARPGRAFSHGCIRVEEPEVLAKYVLRDDPQWDEPRISQAMHAGVEKHVKLHATIPVHIVYFTAWVNDAGGLHFQPDIYGYDAKQAAQRPSGTSSK